VLVHEEVGPPETEAPVIVGGPWFKARVGLDCLDESVGPAERYVEADLVRVLSKLDQPRVDYMRLELLD
jgi:hypothetical protein